MAGRGAVALMAGPVGSLLSESDLGSRSGRGPASRPRLARICLSLVGGLFALIVVAVGATAQTPNPEDGPVSVVRVLRSTRESIVLEVDLDGYTLTKQAVGGEEYDVVSIPDWGWTDQAGAPQLPTRRVLLGIPPDAEVQLKVVDAVVQDDGPFHILPAPAIIVQGDPLEQPGPWITAPQLEKRFTESPVVYGRDAFSPEILAEMGEVGFIRSQRIAAIELYPVQFNPVSQRIRFYSQFLVELSFSYPAGRGMPQSVVAESSTFEQVLQGQLLNYESAAGWRGVPASLQSLPAWPLPGEAYKVSLAQDGIYQLTYDELAAAGVPVGTLDLDPREIQMFSMGEELAIRVVGEEDGVFDSDDYVLFYGQGIRNKYTHQNVYWLTYGQALGRRMSVRDGEPLGSLPSPSLFVAHSRIEQDVHYLPQWPGDDSTDRWYQQYESAPTMTVTVSADLGTVSAEAISSTLWVFMKGRNQALHDALFYVNDRKVGEYEWYGMDTIASAKVDFPQAYLKSGTNTFRTLTDYVLFDRYELRYGRAYLADSDLLEFSQADAGTWAYAITGFTRSDGQVYDISDPMSVTQIVGLAVALGDSSYTLRFSDTVPVSKTYLALTADRWLSPDSLTLDSPSTLHNPIQGADYIVISHADFVTAAQRLATYRAGQGLRTVVVDVQDIYDEFGYGLSIPHAIRDFLRYAFNNWTPPAPAYVVLLGDGTYDPKDHIGQGVVNYITPYLGFVDVWLGGSTIGRLGETATDNWYVAIAGDDILPDMFLGRLPANSLEEANVMVSKTISYETTMQGADWNSQLTFVAGLQPDPKWAGNFHDLSDAVIDDEVPSLYDVSKVYSGQIPGSTCASGADCQRQLIEAINAGTLLVNYTGHGSVVQWENIFNVSAIDQLENSDRFPVMLPMTCLDGYYINALRPDPKYPDLPSLSELVVRTAGKGAVASWGPTGLGVAYGHDALNRGFLDALLHQGIREFGPATYVGKLRLYETGSSLEQIQEYTVFGDPALWVHSLESADVRVEKSVEAPGVLVAGDVVTFTLTFINDGPDAALGVVLTDLIPAQLTAPTVIGLKPPGISQKPGPDFSWTIPDLPPHTGGEVRIRAVADGPPGSAVSFFNTAEIASTTPDLVPGNNRARIAVNAESTYLPLVLKSQK